MSAHRFISSALMAICCFAWTAVYVLALVRAQQDKTHSIPLPAIAANLVWELLYSTVFIKSSPVGPVALVWLFLDVCILAQALWLLEDKPPTVTKWTIIFVTITGMGLCFGLLYFAQMEGLSYITSAFPQNLMMSLLFIQMLFMRPTCAGQSIYIAILKFCGTAAAITLASSPLAALSNLDGITFAGILFFDLLYIYLLLAKYRILGANPWKRS